MLLVFFNMCSSIGPTTLDQPFAGAYQGTKVFRKKKNFTNKMAVQQ